MADGISPQLELNARDVTPCRSCGGALTSNTSMCFYRLRVDTFVLHTTNLQQRGAMQMHFGSAGGDMHAVAAIADVFSPPVVAVGFTANENVLVCLECAMGSLMQMLEAINDRDSKAAEGG